MTFPLAASAEMLFLDRPMGDRIRRIHELGFMVEIWDWTRHDLDELVELRAAGVVYSSMTGYIRGRLSDRAGAAELLETAEQSARVARRLGVPRLNLHGTGLDDHGLPVQPAYEVTPTMWLAARDTLSQIAVLGEREGVTFVLENLNTEIDHPGVPFARAADCLALVSAVDHPHLRLMLDLYHAQIGEGNLVDLCRRALPWIGEIQVADVPGRCEPGTGEVHYPRIALALRELGYTGPVGLEGFASGASVEALARFREAFTL